MIDNLTKDIEDAAPDPSEQVEPPPPDQGQGIEQEKFDPAIHAAGKDGQGIKTQAGTYRKRSGPKKPDKKTPADPAAAAGPGQLQPAAANGKFAADMYFITRAGLCGQASIPKTVKGESSLMAFSGQANQYDYMAGLFTKYFEKEGVPDMPPGWALILGGLICTGAALTDPANMQTATERIIIAKQILTGLFKGPGAEQDLKENKENEKAE